MVAVTMTDTKLSPLGTLASARRFCPLLLSVALGLSLAACDDSAAQKAAQEKAAAAEAEKAEEEKRIEERKAKREAEEKAELEAAAKKQEQIAALAVLPDKYPKKLDKVCAEVGKAQNAFMDRVYADDPETLEKWKATPSAQEMIVATCKKGGSVEAAACQINALNQASADFKKSFPELLSACNEKFGPSVAATPPA